MLRIGDIELEGKLLLAPMAGITDLPFRILCRQFGAALAISEMTSANSKVWETRKSRHRLCLDGEAFPRSVQIAGSEPDEMAAAARMAVAAGADIVDVNMGCPAKKVLRKLAGSALLQDEDLVGRILRAVTSAVDVPVSLKMRTGWNTDNRNALSIAALAEDAGIRAISIHGRTRACRFSGSAEFETIRAVKAAVSVPVIANGDIATAEQAADVLAYTNADAIMIGRASQGQPWLFREIGDHLENRPSTTEVTASGRRDIMLAHLDAIHQFYGKDLGVRVARKHLAWYCQRLGQGSTRAAELRSALVRAENSTAQVQLIETYFDGRDMGETAFNVDIPPGSTAKWRKQEKTSRPKKIPATPRTPRSSKQDATDHCAI
jgi:tRNA-dihydrouridine synthase B